MPCQISLNTYHNNLLKYIVNLLWFVQKENSFLCLLLFSCIHFTQRIFFPWSWKLTCVGTKLWRNITKTFWFLWIFYFHDFVVSLHTCIIAFCWFFFWEALKLCKEKNISNSVQFWDLPRLCWELFTEDLFLLLRIHSTSFPYCSGHLTH